ncbi:MAG: hypothetical protein V1726_02005 [Methanobacteriota archaeon]
MRRGGIKYKKVIELFDGKTSKVVRTIRFHNSLAFEEFLRGFQAKRYPGYSWRYREKRKQKDKHE